MPDEARRVSENFDDCVINMTEDEFGSHGEAQCVPIANLNECHYKYFRQLQLYFYGVDVICSHVISLLFFSSSNFYA